MTKKYLDASESESIKNKQFEGLQKDNEKIRKELKLFISDNGLICERDINHIFIKINELINNEIEQEKLCNN